MPAKKPYSVGYAKPPKHTRFKKGTSGNKKGRPRGDKNIATLLHREMNQRVTISENGQRRTITKFEAALKQLTNKAAKGDPKAFQTIIDISKQLGDLKVPEPAKQQIVRRFTLRIFDKDPETGKRVQVNKDQTQDMIVSPTNRRNVIR